MATRWVQVGRPSRDPEQQHLPPDAALLSRIASETHGTLDMPDRAFLPPTEPVMIQRPLRAWWLALAIVLLLCEVALRGRTLL